MHDAPCCFLAKLGHPVDPAERTWKLEPSSTKQHLLSRSEQDYVNFMEQRDARLPNPRLIYQSVQLNINAGVMPEPETNGMRYLKIPIKKA